MPYIRKTIDEYRLYVNYGGGWEHEITEDTRQDIRQRWRDYRENCPQWPCKWRKVRVKKEESC